MEPMEQHPHAALLSLASEILQEFGLLRLAVYGNSMVPTIFPGDIVTVVRADAGDMRRGDVILYSRGNRFFVHRVVCETGVPGGMERVTRGDALRENDPPVSATELLGKVTVIQRGEKQIVLPGSRSISSRLAAWCVQRSDIVLALFLRWHSLRRRIDTRGAVSTSAVQSPEGSW
ncbi:MAG TPA: S24/S26 family peptidase [Candidatus Acidoferrales bacterium]|nr:S24/S26 family peptidase [Candidatus Acidoferrales bacterium]